MQPASSHRDIVPHGSWPDDRPSSYAASGTALEEVSVPTTRRLRLPLLVGVLLLLIAVVLGLALVRDDGATADPPGLLTVAWGGGTEGPAGGCGYDPATGTVEATLLVSGSPRGDEAILTVTAFADENTSRPVGSTSRALDASTPSPLVLRIPVNAAPHVDEDGVAACSMTVSD